MEYKENILVYEDYCNLRESVGMGRLIGDGMYYMIVDVVVQPDYQKQGI